MGTGVGALSSSNLLAARRSATSSVLLLRGPLEKVLTPTLTFDFNLVKVWAEWAISRCGTGLGEGGRDPEELRV